MIRFHIVVIDGDESQQRIGDAAGTLTMIWKMGVRLV